MSSHVDGASNEKNSLFGFRLIEHKAIRWQKVFWNVKIGNWKVEENFSLSPSINKLTWTLWIKYSFLFCYIISCMKQFNTFFSPLDPIVTLCSPHTHSLLLMYDEIFTNIFSIDCDIWFMQIYFITRIFSAIDDTFNGERVTRWMMKSHRREKRVEMVNEKSKSCN